MPRVLFLSPPTADYLADGVLHGLRALLGDRVVDVPKAAHLYRDAPDGVARDYGRGFTLTRLLADVAVERPPPRQALAQDTWDLVVVGSPWHSVDVLRQAAALRGRTPLVVLDGQDHPHVFPHSLRLRRAHGLRLPRVDRSAIYLKRELGRDCAWLRCYRLLPRALFRAPPRRLHPIAFSIPEEKVLDAPAPKRKEFPRHIVDPEVAAAVGGVGGYAFEEEADYYADLRSSRWGVTTRRAGWDCMRHYEIAANGSVPCFRDLARKEPSCAPHGLVPGVNCIAYGDLGDLRRQIGAVDDRAYAALEHGALAWARANTTRRRAAQVLALAGASTGAADSRPPR